MPSNLRQDLSKGNYRAVIPVAVDGMALVERPNPETGNGGTAFVDTVTLVDETGNILGTSGNPVYVSGGTGPGGTSSANAIANASTQSFASGSSNFLQADLTGALKVNVVAGGGSDGVVTIAAGANAIGSITNTGFAINGSLPSGTNAIGSITNTGFNLTSSIPSGTNNIGVTGVAQGSATSGTYGDLIQGAVTTATPTYTTGQNSPLSLDTSGLLRVNVVSGGGATTATANSTTQSFADGTANSLQADTTGALKVNVVAGSSAANIGVIGAVAPTSSNLIGQTDFMGNLVGVGYSNPLLTNIIGTVTTELATGTNNIGVTGVAQGSTTTGTYGDLIQGAVSDFGPSYTNGTNRPISLDASGNLRVNVVAGGSSAANIGVLGSTAPTSGNYISFANASGNLTGVTATTQLPVASYSRSSQVQVNPTNTAASAYASGNCVGGKLTFDNALGTQLSGTLQNITLTFKSVQTAAFKLYLFSSNPTNTTFTNKSNVSLNALDLPHLIDVFYINAYDSGLGTMTIYPYDNAGRTLYGTTTSLYGVITTIGTPTFVSTSDMYVTISILQD